MKTLLLRLSIAVIFTLPAFSQAYSQAKIALINSNTFKEKNGITRFLTVQSQIAAEFKERFTEMETLQKKLSELTTQLSNPAYQTPAKYDEHEKLNRDFKFKAENYQAQYNKRYNELMNPVFTKIGELVKQWCQQKGYTSVVDVTKDDKGMFVYYDEALLAQTTNELIAFINGALK